MPIGWIVKDLGILKLSKLRHDNKPTIEQLWQVFNFKQQEFVDKKQQELTEKNKVVFDVRQEVYQHCVSTALSKPRNI